jgi:hypothetical protein
MTAGKRNFVIEQGATFEEPIVWMSGGAPVDLTGYTAELLIRPKAGSPVLLRRLSTDNGEIVLGTTNGLITLRVTDEETLLLTSWKAGSYVLNLTAPSGATRRLLQGKVTVSPQ